ncbi:hypothetical protein [Cupriavidus agavae]|uniref:hypothetical protein n=1 Tax=Cupriavidus agavae TaxID=1001822 RepID=UPI00102CF457|nr:hypothetical protein [Cupriavidus agavae]
MDIRKFCRSQPRKKFSWSDYLHATSTHLDLQGDAYLAFFELFRPRFIEVDGVIFVSELFSRKEYDESLARGRTSLTIQPWMNMLEITALFNSIELKDAKRIADAVSHSWNDKLIAEFGSNSIQAQVIVEEAQDEVFVTVGQFQTASGRSKAHSG